MALTRLGLNQAINLATNTTGTLGVANGGTGLASGTSGQFLKFTGATTVASAASGINQFDVWGLSSTNTVSSGEQTLTGWGRLTSRSRATEGSAMTESSGVFTFPVTGKYLITGNFYSDGYTSTHYRGIQLKNNSNQVLQVSYSHGQGSNPSWHHCCVSLNTILDVTDTTDNACKVKFMPNSGGATTWSGSSDDGQATMLFIKLADT
jgi:hypothetical protein